MKSALAFALLAACGGQTLGSAGTEPDAGVAPDAWGGPDGAAADRPGPSRACVNAIVRESRAFHTDIVVMLDMSGSMNCELSEGACDDSRGGSPTTATSRWSTATNAIRALVTSPSMSGHSIALTFFSDVFPSASCEPESYERLHVPMARLPEGAKPIDVAMSGSKPLGLSPLTPALQGAIDYAKGYDLATPFHQAVVLLVTDGLPTLCDSTIAKAATVARNGFAGNPSVKTFVFGVGSTPELDDVAIAGTGGVVHAFAPSDDLAARLEPLLSSMPSNLGCDFVMPEKTDEALDYDSTVVQMTIDGKVPVSMGRVANIGACGDAGGWFYDVDPPKTPSKVTLCPQSCDTLGQADTTRVELVIGCF